MSHTITVIRGDGIGPEIMAATLHVLDKMNLGLQYEEADAGLAAMEKHGELLPKATLDSIAKNKVALKSPLTTPVGEGFSSINVTLRKTFDLYANVRPAKSFPNTKSRFPSGVDLITVRENTEGLYIGDGQALSDDGEVATATSRITQDGAERVVRYAFELARRTGRKKVTVVHKANILKSTSGLFLRTARGGGVAKRSLHMDGKAIDVRLPGVPLADLRDAALSLGMGGVGFYPREQFVHVDTGPVRRW